MTDEVVALHLQAEKAIEEKIAPSTDQLVDTRVHQYVILRDKMKEMEERHKEEKQKLQDALDRLDGWFTSLFDKLGVAGVRTAHGTASKSTKFSASLSDPHEFMRHVIGTQNFDLLDRRANVTAVKAYVEENGSLPPGCNLTPRNSISVRRKSGT